MKVFVAAVVVVAIYIPVVKACGMAASILD